MGEISYRSSFNILVMNKLIYIVFFLLFTLTASAQDAWPDVKVENAKGEVISTKNILGGKPAIVSFWGVTCKRKLISTLLPFPLMTAVSQHVRVPW